MNSPKVAVPDDQSIYRILVVEDNEGDIRLIQEAFLDCGYCCQLTRADTMEAAKEMLRTKAFHLVLSDMGTNDERLDLIRSIRSDNELKATPVVVLSGMCDSRAAYEAGANAFILKAANLDEFFGKIKALMHFWVDIAELPQPVKEVP